MNASEHAWLEVGDAGRATLSGPLIFATAAALLPCGAEAIKAKRVASIDLSAVSGADSAGLALLVEWLSVAKAAGQALHYDNIPSQLLQLAKLSDVDGLLSGQAA